MGEKKKETHRYTNGRSRAGNLWFSFGKALQGEIKNVTDPHAAAAFNSYECLKGALPRRSG